MSAVTMFDADGNKRRASESIKPRKFRTATLADCRERGPQWAVQRTIEQGTVTAVTGEPGSAKTFLLIDLALHVAAGREWFGRKVQRGAVLYIAAEAHDSVLRRMALARRVKFQNAELPVRIVTEAALLGDEVHCATDREGLELLVDEVAAEFGQPVVLVLVDTVAASMGTGKENLDGMQRLVAAANLLAGRTGAAVVLNHHPSANGGALRGHSSLRGTVSHGFQIEVQGEVRTVAAFKQRDAEAGRLFAYRLDVFDLGEPDNFGDRATSCTVTQAEIPEPAERTEECEQTRLTIAVREAFAVKAPHGALLRFSEIAEHCAASCDFLHGKSSDAERRAVGRALRSLTEAGVLLRSEVPRGQYRLTPEHRT